MNKVTRADVDTPRRPPGGTGGVAIGDEGQRATMRNGTLPQIRGGRHGWEMHGLMKPLPMNVAAGRAFSRIEVVREDQMATALDKTAARRDNGGKNTPDAVRPQTNSIRSRLS